ncbi:MAG: hypothetical protein QG671_297 [Actinomycetota bacterium]|nr:hypothetical protein [Actinomycetota bacterium]
MILDTMCSQILDYSWMVEAIAAFWTARLYWARRNAKGPKAR